MNLNKKEGPNEDVPILLIRRNKIMGGIRREGPSRRGEWEGKGGVRIT